MSVNRTYGLHPEVYKTDFMPPWHEYMHWLYLPVFMPDVYDKILLPDNLEFLRPIIEGIERDEDAFANCLYLYVSARRGFAHPGNPLNRPGWHADGFGSNDINYIWSDRWPTRFATGVFTDISGDHVLSAQQFDEQIADSLNGPIPGNINVWEGEPNTIYRLDPSVVHATPLIQEKGGDRSFFKVSVSPDKYNLLGNSHNHDFDYEWKMWDRSEVRNDPAWAGGDTAPQQ